MQTSPLGCLVRFCALVAGVFMFFILSANNTFAFNINEYSDTLSDSGPGHQSNHTLGFVLNTDVSAGGSIEVTPPSGFTILATTTFEERNVQLVVNGGARTASSTAAAGIDMVEITPGSPGLIKYTLAPDFNITSGSNIELRIGNHTTNSNVYSVSHSTSTGTTTVAGDVEPITNTVALGVHEVSVDIYDGGLVAEEDFVIFINEKVKIPNADTRESIPPFRFNPAPTSTVGGTTLSVEVSLETDELAVCRFDSIPDTAFGAMPNVFENTGQIFHSQIVAVTPNSVNRFYVRCRDDEGNFNIDDFIIVFTVNEVPTGTSNTDGSTDGDGTGSGDEGGGTGSGGGGTSGASDGEEPFEGGTSGAGGSGGGGGGGSGGSSGSSGGGGFEDGEAPYESGDGRVIISGYAFPGSTVSVLVDSNFFDTTIANDEGRFSVTLDEIARGVYTFGIYAEDSNDVKSSTFSTSFTVTGARTSSLGNVNISPSILVTPDPVDPGEIATISGFSLPNASIVIENSRINSNSPQEFFAVSDADGEWSTTINTTGFSLDTYQVRAKAEQVDGASANFSGYTFYGVGGEADVPINSDLNRDGSVNLIDFSILLFWWNSNGGDSDPPADINGDGGVNLIDFSILLFNWTG